ncbi:MAG: hypothetical protein U0768_18055 [Anaerolineae bacterium]
MIYVLLAICVVSASGLVFMIRRDQAAAAIDPAAADCTGYPVFLLVVIVGIILVLLKLLLP